LELICCQPVIGYEILNIWVLTVIILWRILWFLFFCYISLDFILFLLHFHSHADKSFIHILLLIFYYFSFERINISLMHRLKLKTLRLSPSSTIMFFLWARAVSCVSNLVDWLGPYIHWLFLSSLRNWRTGGQWRYCGSQLVPDTRQPPKDAPDPSFFFLVLRVHPVVVSD
jgi:hypothetical protein